MLGCGFERCTAIHLPEELIAPNVYLVPGDQAEPYTLRDRLGASFTMTLRRHRRLNRCFEKFEPTLESKGRLRRGVLANTPFMLCSHDDLVEEVLGDAGDRSTSHAGPGRRRDHGCPDDSMLNQHLWLKSES